MKKALICGILGQDGAYLANLLLKKEYEVWGTSRDAQLSSYDNLIYLNIKDQVNMISMMQTDTKSVFNAVEQSKPDEIYFLSGQSSVGLSFSQPIETFKSFSIGILNILDAIRSINPKIKLYNASSSECFGNTGKNAATEGTAFKPCSPYGVSKAAAHWFVVNHRESFNIFCCNGMLFNHESHLRQSRFVTKKIISTVCNISKGIEDELVLGRTDIARDWGWAPEYVEAMWMMLQCDTPDDFIIATGRTVTLKEFVKESFKCVGLEDWERYITYNPDYNRNSDLLYSAGNPSKAKLILGWEATVKMPHLVKKLVEEELNSG